MDAETIYAYLDGIAGQVSQQGEQLETFTRDFSNFRAGLADTFTPRRETEAIDKRVIALEEWRLNMTQREGDRLASLQQQISTAQMQAQNQINAANQATTTQTNAAHTAMSERMLNISVSVGLLLGGGILSYVFSHLLR